MEHLSQRDINLPGWKKFLGTHFSSYMRPGTMRIYSALERCQCVQSIYLLFLLETYVILITSYLTQMRAHKRERETRVSLQISRGRRHRMRSTRKCRRQEAVSRQRRRGSRRQPKSRFKWIIQSFPLHSYSNAVIFQILVSHNDTDS